MKNQKGLIQIILVVGIIALLGFIGYMFYIQRQKPEASYVPAPYQAQYNEAQQAVAPVQNSKDLDSVSTGLDAEDTAQIDTQIKALDTASAGF